MSLNKSNSYCFVGEARSKLAIKRKIYWKDGKLAGKQLFDAIKYCGLDTNLQVFINSSTNNVKLIKSCSEKGVKIVGMGKVAQERLNKWRIKHIPIIHPAARGRIRNKQNYCEHVKTKLFNYELE